MLAPFPSTALDGNDIESKEPQEEGGGLQEEDIKTTTRSSDSIRNRSGCKEQDRAKISCRCNNMAQPRSSSRLFSTLFGRLRFNIPSRAGFGDLFMSLMNTIVDGFVYLLGPFLIVFASAIIAGLAYVFFTIILPMIQRSHQRQAAALFTTTAEGAVEGAVEGGADATAALSFLGLVQWYFHLVVPWFHVAFVLFLLTHIIINYVLCVTTRHQGALYQTIVREMADATGFCYPETPDDVTQCKRDYEDRMIYRMQRRQARYQQAQQLQAAQQQAQQAQQMLQLDQQEQDHQQQLQHVSTSSSSLTDTLSPSVLESTTKQSVVTHRKNHSSSPSTTTTTHTHRPPPPPPARRWMIMGPHEWGFCNNSNQPKPPRSHYDHVTKTLCLNMDHYCPWMFNVVGYFNYRYFFNFLLYVSLGMAYGAAITLRPFMTIQTRPYYQQIRQHKAAAVAAAAAIKQASSPVSFSRTMDYVPLPSERTPVAFSFMICLSVGLAVLTLLGFHAYLLCTAQTTIEFHANCANRRRARRLRNSNSGNNSSTSGNGSNNSSSSSSTHTGKSTWKNPYDLGWRQNIKQVYGHSHSLWWNFFVPSAREPEYLPVPIPGQDGRRSRVTGKKEVDAASVV